MTDTSSIVDSIVAGLAHEGLDGYEVYMTRSSGLTIEDKVETARSLEAAANKRELLRSKSSTTN
jgi:hypothetical protein